VSGIADVPAAIERIAGVLTRLGIRHAFGGAIAQNYWGVVRATQDVDVLALIPSVRLQDAVDAMQAAGFRARDAQGNEHSITVADVRASQTRYNLFAVWSGLVKVELFSPVLPLQHRMLDRARSMPWRDRTIMVTSPEDLVLIKMVFHREKDLRDIRAIVATSGDRLDRSYMTAQAAEVLDGEHQAELMRLLGP